MKKIKARMKFRMIKFTGYIFVASLALLGCFYIARVSASNVAEDYNCLTKELWTEDKRIWCCTNKNLGCNMLTRGRYNISDEEESSSSSAANSAAAAPVPTVSAVPPHVALSSTDPFDCFDDVSDDATGKYDPSKWTEAKKEWCCKHKSTGPECTTDTVTLFTASNGAEVMYEYNSNRSPRAILFLAHGCSHSATDFWPKSLKCPQCLGLPEERRIVKAALKRGYVAVAVSSKDRIFSKCWRSEDGQLVADAIQEVVSSPGHASWGKLPVLAVGASSGGAFVGGMLGKHLALAAVDIQIMALSQAPDFQVPPAAFTYMSKDHNMKEYIDMNINAWRSRGTSYIENVVESLPLSAKFFSSRIEGMTEAQSERVFNALDKSGYLDRTTKMLIDDPRMSNWRQVLMKEYPEIKDIDSLEGDKSPISEELNVAWAMHEFVSDYIEKTFGFFEEMMMKKKQTNNTTSTKTKASAPMH